MELRKKGIHFESFPEAGKDHKIGFSTEDIVSLNSAVWKVKKDKNLSLKAELQSLVITKNLKPIEKELMYAHSAKQIGYGDKIEITL